MMKLQKWLGGASCALAVLVAGCASDGNSRSTGQVIDDTAIHAKTKAALLNDPVVSGRAVNVDVSRGVVTLEGSVNGSAEKQKAEDIARGVDGVRSVENNLVIRNEASGAGATVEVDADTDKDAKIEADADVDVDTDDKSIDTKIDVDKK